ncbi:penicillin acylase family protein [Massilia glaciei]|uniref:Acylase n=1 Tax=Massilia glaciei TaxID=1524097 RepID=A0A2U2HJM9_9BURK|nr:penicillin acylase family protein [Massilia glaciei]PWF47699.1 acylase [Massilia glaciei]
MFQTRLAVVTLLGCAAFGAMLGATAAPQSALKAQTAQEHARWKKSASDVTILRDKWGIPHVFGKSDADAVFGLLYAQAEDDFNRVERNYITALGRMAEVEGESALWSDLRMKLFIRPADMKAKYADSPAWLKKLMVAFADGLNFYLHTHPEVKPKLITHFEPWMALAFSEGSIGGDIEDINLARLEQFYGKGGKPALADSGFNANAEPRGSNGFAIAPKLSASGNALLLINPHTSFYFRPEVHMVSEQGLNAYGAVTWGQFFVYQGFNERAGWMHTSGGGDVIDEYRETVVEKDGRYFYKYGGGERLVRAEAITLPFKGAGGMDSKTITAYFTHHGPVVRAADGKWIAVKLMEEPLKALMQSYSRTKAKNYAAFTKTMELRTNSSNNTVFADRDGNIAYFHGNFVPRRDVRFDWKLPVDGSDPATEWKGLHRIGETITLLNPASGYILNTNNWPFSASGASSPRIESYPSYMWTLPENHRGVHAARVLEKRKDFTLESLIASAYDTALPGFERLIANLGRAYDGLAADDPLRARLQAQVAALRGWDTRYSVESVPTSLAIYWGQDMVARAAAAAGAMRVPVHDYIGANVAPREQLEALARASAKLEADFGSWQTPWGQINRFQRVSGDVRQQYDDSKPSYPVAFPSAAWGALASFGMTAKQTTKRLYGDRGNSFVAAVEFGPRVRAKSILAGGQSGDPASPHFNDQAEMYSKGEFKDVLFYKADIERHLARKYHPGQ